jgi:hypothetical protein
MVSLPASRLVLTTLRPLGLPIFLSSSLGLVALPFSALGLLEPGQLDLGIGHLS